METIASINLQLGFKIVGVIFSLVGTLLVVLALFRKKKPKPFFLNALKAQGTVIDLGVSQPRSFKKRRYSTPAYTQVTIEYLTNTQQKIQGDIDTDFTLFYSGQYQKGDKVNLLYNPENPTEFIVTSLQSTLIAKLIMLVVGICLLLTGIGMELLINTFSSLQK